MEPICIVKLIHHSTSWLWIYGREKETGKWIWSDIRPHRHPSPPQPRRHIHRHHPTPRTIPPMRIHRNPCRWPRDTVNRWPCTKPCTIITCTNNPPNPIKTPPIHLRTTIRTSSRRCPRRHSSRNPNKPIIIPPPPRSPPPAIISNPSNPIKDPSCPLSSSRRRPLTPARLPAGCLPAIWLGALGSVPLNWRIRTIKWGCGLYCRTWACEPKVNFGIKFSSFQLTWIINFDQCHRFIC